MNIRQITDTERELFDRIEYLTTQRDSAVADRDYWKDQARILKADRYQHAEAMARFEELKADRDALRKATDTERELLDVLREILADGMHCDVVPHLHRKAHAAILKATGEPR